MAIIFDKNGNQIGEVYDDKTSGEGISTQEDGCIYTGQWLYGRYHGLGVLKKNDGEVLDGVFYNGFFVGSITVKKNNAYQKISSLDEIYGQTVQILYKNGDVYEGYWVDGCRNGFGELRCVNQPTKKGFFKKDRFIGEVKNLSKDMLSPRDEQFEGEVDITYPDNKRYVGHWKNGKPDGYGTLYIYDSYYGMDSNCDEFYTGMWENGLKSGRNGYVCFKSGLKYHGDFKNNRYHGYGELTYPNGSTFRGFFQDNQRNGQGSMYYYDGVSCTGHWSNNNKDGVFVYFFKNLGKVELEYCNNRPVRGKYETMSGKHFIFSKSKKGINEVIDGVIQSDAEAIYEFCFVLNKDVLFDIQQNDIQELLKLAASKGCDLAKRSLPQKKERRYFYDDFENTEDNWGNWGSGGGWDIRPDTYMFWS